MLCIVVESKITYLFIDEMQMFYFSWTNLWKTENWNALSLWR